MHQISSKNLNISYFNKNIDRHKKQKCAFFDRDGIIIEDVGYLSNIENIKFIDGIFETVSELKKQSYLFGIITNQSGIARGYFSMEKFLEIQTYINKIFSKNNLEIDFLLACPYFKNGNPPYDKDNNFRKPKPGMINEGFKQINVDKKTSFLIGDRISDIKCAERAGLNKAYILPAKDVSMKEIISLRTKNFFIEEIKTIKEII